MSCSSQLALRAEFDPGFPDSADQDEQIKYEQLPMGAIVRTETFCETSPGNLSGVVSLQRSL